VSDILFMICVPDGFKLVTTRYFIVRVTLKQTHYQHINSNLSLLKFIGSEVGRYSYALQ